jgi:nicotinamide phosphoribosyltransferase
MHAKENLILDVDSYKLDHFLQYPEGTTALFAYLESRGGRYGSTVFFGLQPLLQRLDDWGVEYQHTRDSHVEEAAAFAKAHGLTFNEDGWRYIARDLKGRIPIRVRAVQEGSVVPVRNALMTVESTDPKVPWVVTWFETQLMRVWYPTTVATKSFYCVKTIWEFLKETADAPESEIAFKLHDFGGRGVSTAESAAIGGAAHLVNSLGTDTIIGARFAKDAYGSKDAVLGYSIPAMEHSTVTSHKSEVAAFLNMIDKHPEHKILACVSDSYDIDNAVENIWAGELLDIVKANGKTIVIRPDSGNAPEGTVRILHILDRKLGCKVNSKGFKVLPPYFRIIWGDGNKTEDDIRDILQAVKIAGFSASNIAFGMGGGLLQLVDRDTQQFAFKVSAALINNEWRDIKKTPKTDAHKVSKAGRLELIKEQGEYKTIALKDGTNLYSSELHTVFENGEVKKTWTFDEVRAQASRMRSQP